MIRNIAIFQSPEFTELCRAHQVKELYVFGSIARGSDTDASDVDLLVEIDESDPVKRGKFILSLYNKLSTYFNRKVDLLTVDSLKNPALLDSINSSKQIIFSRND